MEIVMKKLLMEKLKPPQKKFDKELGVNKICLSWLIWISRYHACYLILALHIQYLQEEKIFLLRVVSDIIVPHAEFHYLFSKIALFCTPLMALKRN